MHRPGLALGECSGGQALTQVHRLDLKNTRKGHRTANGKGSETTEYNRKPGSSFASGVSMPHSSQGRCLEGKIGFQEPEGWQAPHSPPLQRTVDATGLGVAEGLHFTDEKWRLGCVPVFSIRQPA